MSESFAKLRWCTGGSETRRFRVKLMLLIPAVLLPITILFIALSRFQATAKASDLRAVSMYEMREQDKEKMKDDVFWRKFHNCEYTRAESN